MPQIADGFGGRWRCSVVGVQFRQIASNLGIDLGQSAFEFLGREGAGPVAHSFEWGTINGDEFTAEQVKLLTQQGNVATHAADRGEIVFAEVGNRCEVRGQRGEQPHDLDVAVRFTFKQLERVRLR